MRPYEFEHKSFCICCGNCPLRPVGKMETAQVSESKCDIEFTTIHPSEKKKQPKNQKNRNSIYTPKL